MGIKETIMNRAIFWIATEDKYIQEAQQSALSVRECMPDIMRILLYPSLEQSGPEIGVHNFGMLFYGPERKHEFYYQDFVNYLNIVLDWLSDFDQLLYLDTDTYMAHSCYEIFDLLDKFDLVSTHAPARIIFDTNKPVPQSFCELNTGVLAFNNNDRIRQLFKDWLSTYTDEYENDQTPLREVLWQSGVNHYVMPHEYNFRFNSGGQVAGLVKIFHGRHRDIKNFVELVNSNKGIRIVNRKGIIG